MISTGITRCNLVACKTLSESGGVFMFSCNWWARNVISLERSALPLMTLKVCHFSICVIQFLVQAKEVGAGEGVTSLVTAFSRPLRWLRHNLLFSDWHVHLIMQIGSGGLMGVCEGSASEHTMQVESGGL